MRPFDVVILNEDLNDSIPAGTEGTIVDQYAHVADVYIVEFFDREGRTLDVVDVRTDQITVTLSDFFAGEHIALLADFPKHKLLRGQVGVIKQRVGVGLYEVEFVDAHDKPYSRLTLHAQQMLLLHWQPVQSKQSA